MPAETGGEKLPPRRQAVALKYQPGEQEAPEVVAAGRGEVAEKIIATARQAGVPIHEDPALAGVLCRLELGQAIPAELYQAVAQVLAFIFKLEAR